MMLRIAPTNDSTAIIVNTTMMSKFQHFSNMLVRRATSHITAGIINVIGKKPMAPIRPIRSVGGVRGVWGGGEGLMCGTCGPTP